MNQAPVIRCRMPDCQQVMNPLFQCGFGYFPDSYLVTCENPLCVMNGQTLGARDYADLDLTPYLKLRKATA